MTESAPAEDSLNVEADPDHSPESQNMLNDYQNQTAWKAQKALFRQALPLLLLLVISVVVRNFYEIFLFLALVLAFDHVNSFVVKQSELPRGTSAPKNIAVLLYFALCLYLVYPIVEKFWILQLDDFGDWYSHDATFWGTLYLVVVIDFLCKYVTICMKCIILLLSGKVLPVRARGRIFMVCEGVSQVTRCLIPIPQWTRYITSADLCVSHILCWILVAGYVFLKMKAAKEKLFLIRASCRRRTTSGINLHPIDLHSIPDDSKLCAICHLGHTIPVSLPCSHIYCRDCICLWLDREQHCPQCASVSVSSLVLGLQSVLSPVAQYTSSNSKWKTGTTDYVIQMF